MLDYVAFFLNSNRNVVQLETLEISHPSFTKAYRIVRNKILGLDATLEDGITLTHFDYYPCKIVTEASTDDLDQKMQIQFGDTGDILPTELDAVARGDNFGVKPTCIYRSYRSDDLSAPMRGPLNFFVVDLSFNQEGASFEAGAPKVNVSSTGEIYSLDRFPMLRGFL